MALRETVFGSKSEERVFEHLKSVWNDKFNLFHNLPFAQIFDINTIDLNKYVHDLSFWKRTLLMSSVDYVVCDEQNKPLICIEFDGLCRGYNKGITYFQDNENKWRKRKLELKLKIAKDHDFPFYIVSYEETDLLSKKSKYNSNYLNLAVVDAIIGQTMKHYLLSEKVNEYLDSYEDYLNSLKEYEQDEFIQECVIDAEVDLELKWDPIAIRAAKLEGILHKKGLTSLHGYKFIEKPETPNTKGLHDYEGIKQRVEALKKVKWQGCEVHWETPDGTIVREAWIRNFEGTSASPLIIIQNIADLLTLYEIAEKYQVEIPKEINEDYYII